MKKLVSLYDTSLKKGEILKHRGFDYSKSLFSRTSSEYLFKNDTVSSFISYLNDIFYVYIEAVKKIRVFHNFTVKKDYKNIP